MEPARVDDASRCCSLRVLAPCCLPEPFLGKSLGDKSQNESGKNDAYCPDDEC